MASYNLFGFLFKDRNKAQQTVSFAPPHNDDGAMVIEGTGINQHVVDIDGSVRSEIELITKYREISQRPEVEGAISEIVNEAIVTEEKKRPISLVTDKLKYSEEVIAKIQEEFENILDLLDFNNEGQDIFRRWYVDGRLYYHMIIDPNNPRDGIQELREIDPRRIKPVIEVESLMTAQGVPVKEESQRYYVYSPYGSESVSATTGVKVAWDSICCVHSGIREPNNTMILGWLNKALKTSNMLTMVEDASVIYRLSRAPERRVFYIDVGTLPKQKAEQYLKDIMSKYRNKMVYDATTGEIREDKKFLSFMEDYWLPRREGGRGTEITTLPGGENLGEMADVEYFKEKLFQSLNVPVSRLQSQATMSFGEGSSITREEWKFGKFIYRLRNRFKQLFEVLLSTQLMLKGIIAKEDWQVIRQNLHYDYLKDTYYSEMKNLEIMRERLGACDAALNYVGKYFPHDHIRRFILQQTDQDIEKFDAQMKKEKSDPRYQAIEAMTGGGMGMGMGMGMDPSMGGDPSMMGGDPNDPNAMGGDPNDPNDPNAMDDQGGYGDEQGGEEPQQPQQQPQPRPPQQASQHDDDDDDSPLLDPDSLPTERITQNVEKLWRR